MTVLVGGVSQLYQGDFDFGRAVVERLATQELDGVQLAHLDYGAVAVAQELQDVRPETLILVGAAERGRPPGMLERREVGPLELASAQVGAAVAAAVTGYVSIDLVLEVASGLGALPRDTLSIELEPALHGPSEQLSREGRAAVEGAVAVIRQELRRRRAPLPGGRGCAA